MESPWVDCIIKGGTWKVHKFAVLLNGVHGKPMSSQYCYRGYMKSLWVDCIVKGGTWKVHKFTVLLKGAYGKSTSSLYC